MLGMDLFLDKMVENGCVEGNPILRLVQELDWSSCDSAVRPVESPIIHGRISLEECLSPKSKDSAIDRFKDALPVSGQKARHEASDLYDPLQTLFLAEPQFFATTLLGSSRTGNKNTSPQPVRKAEYFRDHFTRFFENDSPSHSPAEHHDDCTPSSGSDYLMEVQNPTWEMELYSQMYACFSTCSDLVELAQSKTAVMDFSRFFGTSVVDHPNIYERTTRPSENVESAFERGKDLMSKNKVIVALSFLETAVEEKPDDKERWTLLALCQYLLQDDSRSASACIEFLKYCSSEDPARSLILLILATCLANEGDMAASSGVLFQWCIEVLDISDSDVTKVTQQLKSSPKQFFLNPKLIMMALAEILITYEASESTTFFASMNWAKAILYFGLEEFASALHCFEVVAAHCPQSPSVLNQIAACHHNLKNLDRAVEYQDKALELLPVFPRTMYNKATTLFAMEKVEKALEVIQSVLDQQAGVDAGLPWDQFWYLAARFIPRLPAKEETQYKRRKQLMSAILTRNVKEFKVCLEDLRNDKKP